mmetsp:Transcript_24313/g.41493  ORF Transcript_24313/g.41493 Transcript_24313/m.41493 type:complete len:146 (+) Transcript_24313:236-673(+)
MNMMFINDNRTPKPNYFDRAVPEAEEDETAIEVQLGSRPTAFDNDDIDVGRDAYASSSTEGATAIEVRLSNILGHYLTSRSTASGDDGVHAGSDANTFSSSESQASESNGSSNSYNLRLWRLLGLSVLVAACASAISVVSKSTNL